MGGKANYEHERILRMRMATPEFIAWKEAAPGGNLAQFVRRIVREALQGGDERAEISRVLAESLPMLREIRARLGRIEIQSVRGFFGQEHSANLGVELSQALGKVDQALERVAALTFHRRGAL